MIIPNGTISFATTTEGGLDEKGYPVSGAVSWGEEVPCQYYSNSQNYLATDSNGEHHIQAKWTILLESFESDGLKLGWKEKLRLKNRDGEVVGEYSVIQFEPLDAVRQSRIIV